MAQYPVAFVSEGESIDYTPGSAVVAGAVILQGTMIGIATQAIAANTKGALLVRGEVSVPKDNGNWSAVGTAVYWDADGTQYQASGSTYDAGGCFTSTPTGNTFAGWCLEIAGTTTGTCRILLRSGFSVSVTTTDDLTDVGTPTYTAGDILVGDGTVLQGRSLSGPLTLSAAGLVAVKSATVAASGTGSGDSVIAQGFTLVTAANGTKAVTLPAAAAGALCIIKNADAQVLKVFPGTGDKINGGTATTGQLNVPASTAVLLVAYDATDWYSLPLLPS